MVVSIFFSPPSHIRRICTYGIQEHRALGELIVPLIGQRGEVLVEAIGTRSPRVIIEIRHCTAAHGREAIVGYGTGLDTVLKCPRRQAYVGGATVFGFADHSIFLPV